MIYFTDDAIAQSLDVFEDDHCKERAVSYINLRLICEPRKPLKKILVVVPDKPVLRIYVDANPEGDYDWEVTRLYKPS